MHSPVPTRAALAASVALALAACGGGSKSSSPSSNGPTGALVSVGLSSAVSSIPIDRTLRLGVYALNDRSEKADVTAQASFASSNLSVIQVLGTNELDPVAAGTATITATYQGKTVQRTFTVTGIVPTLGPGASNDPLLPGNTGGQWHLYNSGAGAAGSAANGYAYYGGVAGFDINAMLTWSDYGAYSGVGVKVAVVDSGLEIAHEDLLPNVVTGSWNFATGTSDPTSAAVDGDHGTMVAGLIGAVAGNGKGGMGVAPGVGLNGYNLLGDGVIQSSQQFSASLGGGTGVNGPRSNNVWVFNQSFVSNNYAPDVPIGSLESIYMGGVTNLRDGFGAIYVKSAGNGFRSFGAAACGDASAQGVTCHNTSMDSNNTIPANIVVAAVNASGVKSSYSSAGSAVWVSSYGGEYGLTDPGFCPGNVSPCSAAMVTTDQSGTTFGTARTGETSSAFNGLAAPNQAGNYTNTMNGTSSAAPVTSGVVALMLEANPSLSWRDVKHILAKKAFKVDAGIAAKQGVLGNGGTYVAEPAWTNNAAGYHFHNWYGFGLVDADAAVSTALHYAPGQLGTFRNSGWLPGTVTAATIPSDSTVGGYGTLTMVPTGALTIEAVQVQVTINHPYGSALGVELISPSGTRSVLLNALSGLDTSAHTPWVIQLASNAFYGESTTGTWALKVVDVGSGINGALNGFSIRFYGH